MRNFINIMEKAAREWWDYPHDTIDQLAALKDLFLQNSGTDNDEGSLSELVPDADEENVESEYFDLCIETFRHVSRSGHLTLYRAISVDDVDAFVAAVEKGTRLGNHWTYHDHAASTSYHSEQQKEHLLMLVCEAPVSSVDWSTSLQQHFSHPYEHEIFRHRPGQADLDLKREQSAGGRRAEQGVENLTDYLPVDQGCTHAHREVGYQNP